MAQNDWAGEYINIRYAGFCLESDNSNSSDSDSDSDSECDSVSPNFQL